VSSNHDDALAWPEDAPPVDRLTHPTGGDTAFAVACAGSMWPAPIIGPLVLRLFLRDRPFSLHWFRLSLLVQLVYVGLFVLGFYLSVSKILPGTITTFVVMAAYLWGLYTSIFSLVKILRGKAETIPPVPPSLLQRG
jgi:hypothetical protein